MSVAYRAIAFDLGDTLIEYEGIPLNWEAHYPEALTNLSAALDIQLNGEQLEQGCEVLRRANTRLYPREHEITFAALLTELLECLGMPGSSPYEESACTQAFFDVFRQKLRCFPEVPETLSTLRRRGVRLGIYTDVPYGMPTALIQADLLATGLEGAVDVLLTSYDTGLRKPTAGALQLLVGQLACHPAALIHVGNERKDIQVAKAVGCTSVLIDRAGQGHDWGQDYTISSLTQLCSDFLLS
ncbi:MAG: HAD family hydrolase [Armatimonas sp.]